MLKVTIEYFDAVHTFELEASKHSIEYISPCPFSNFLTGFCITSYLEVNFINDYRLVVEIGTLATIRYYFTDGKVDCSIVDFNINYPIQCSDLSLSVDAVNLVNWIVKNYAIKVEEFENE